jgi:hypothetical protein
MWDNLDYKIKLSRKNKQNIYVNIKKPYICRGK